MGRIVVRYKQQSVVPIESETHGGQDVGVWASGPDARLASGTYEQNYIFFVFAHALQLEAVPTDPTPQVLSIAIVMSQIASEIAQLNSYVF